MRETTEAVRDDEAGPRAENHRMSGTMRRGDNLPSGSGGNGGKAARQYGEKGEYVLGTDEAELRRLGFQNRLWSREAAAGWERAGFAPGHTILDVGCGPGHASFDIAQLVGVQGKVIAVDASERFIAYLQSQQKSRNVPQIDARVGNVQKLDLPAGIADGAYTRWVLCFVPDPEAVVAGVAKVLKPGAKWVVQDYYHYRGLRLCPHSPAMEKVVAAVDKSWRDRGGDPDIVSRLPTLMAKHGLETLDVRPIVRLARPGSALWQWPPTFFDNYLPVLVQHGHLMQADADAFNREWAARTNDPSAFFSTPPMAEVMAVRKA